MKVSVTILFLALCMGLGAQTRRIAYRFHSGADHARYDGRDGNYGDPFDPRIRIHLESGRDTIVDYWDTLANPKYLHYIDSFPRAMIYPRMGRQEDIRDMGSVTHRLTTKS
jgi:hypothetical protein